MILKLGDATKHPAPAVNIAIDKTIAPDPYFREPRLRNFAAPRGACFKVQVEGRWWGLGFELQDEAPVRRRSGGEMRR